MMVFTVCSNTLNVEYGSHAIELMNHHVRNALQTIVSSAYAHRHARQLEGIRTSVKRIEWALREILPGRILES